MLKGLFDFDGGLMGFFSKISDIVILNLIFVVTCIPIVTIGPALTALYAVTLKMAKKEESYIVRSYFKAFKQDFKMSLLSWLIILVVVVTLVVDYRISTLWSNSMGTIMSILSLVLLFLCFVISQFLFPYIARFENTLGKSFKSAAFMAVAELPKTLLLIIITGIYIIIVAFLMPVPYAIFIGILCGFSLLAFLQSIIFRKIFVKYEGSLEEEVE